MECFLITVNDAMPRNSIKSSEDYVEFSEVVEELDLLYGVKTTFGTFGKIMAVELCYPAKVLPLYTAIVGDNTDTCFVERITFYKAVKEVELDFKEKRSRSKVVEVYEKFIEEAGEEEVNDIFESLKGVS